MMKQMLLLALLFSPSLFSNSSFFNQIINKAHPATKDDPSFIGLDDQTTHPQDVHRSFQHHFNQANDFFYQREYRKAQEQYELALSFDSSVAECYFNLAVALFEESKYEESRQKLHAALNRNPSYAKAHLFLGKIEQKKNNLEGAKQSFERALECNKNLTDAYTGLAHIHSEQQQYDIAIAHLRAAHQLDPNSVQIYFDLANALNTANYTIEALRIYKELAQKHPTSTAILYNIAYTLKKLGRIEDSLPFYDAVTKLCDDHVEAHFGRGLAYLTKGDFEKGWIGYESRWKRQDRPSSLHFDKPMWNGTDSIAGKRFLIHTEQGLGDTFQFIRYAQYLKQKGAHVICMAQDPLVRVLTLCPYLDEVFPRSHPIPAFDEHAPLLSLPYIFKTRLESVPHDIPYLYASPELEARWKERIAHDTNLKVGICWQGNDKYSTAFLRAVVAAKSIALSAFAPLGQIPGVTLYSLQKVTGENQLENVSSTFKLVTFDEDFDGSAGRFMDTFALIKNLDLVISVDTSICHVAAGLGKPVWTILPEPADWRWMLNTEETPWYPNMRLFRQPEVGAWQPVIDRVARELRHLVENKKESIKTTPAASFTHYGLGDAIEKLVSNSLINKKGITQESELHSLTKRLEDVLRQLYQLSSKTPEHIKNGAMDKDFLRHIHQICALDKQRVALKEEINRLGA